MDVSISFFKTVQNKMHWAITGQIAAEIIHHRVDHSKDNMGLTNLAWRKGQKTGCADSQKLSQAYSTLHSNSIHSPGQSLEEL